MKVLYTWIGKKDLDAIEQYPAHGEIVPNSQQERPSGRGPVADVLLNLDNLDCSVLLSDFGDKAKQYCDWLKALLTKAGKRIELHNSMVNQGDPTSFTWVYDAMRRSIDAFERGRSVTERFYLVGPGTPTMAACTIIVARLNACSGTLLQTDVKSRSGFRPLELPVALNLEDAPDPAGYAADRSPDAQVQKAASAPIVLSASTKRAFELAQRAARSQWPVLILGNTGTGKEELARYIYRNSNCKGAFVPVNCGAIPSEMIEAELFGYRKGAFTGAVRDHQGVFEAAGDGVVFLDEVGELPLQAQTRFLRVLQERKVVRLGEHEEHELKCRIVAATHRNLWQAVREGSFRADLYYRLAGLIITLDDLAQRPEDLQAMIESFWQEIVAENPGFPGRVLSDAAREQLLRHPWPGNVRQLKATLVRLAFLAKGPQVGADDVALALDTAVTMGARLAPQMCSASLDTADFDFKTNTRRYQLGLVRRALDAAGGNKSRAARMLGLSVQHLNRLLKQS